MALKDLWWIWPAFLLVALVVNTRKIRRMIGARDDAVAVFARQQGWQYSKQDQHDIAARFTGEPFDKGRVRWASHVISATHRGRPMLAFDYNYTIDNEPVPFKYLVVAVGTPSIRPVLQVEREGGKERMAGLVGVRDLQLESQQFNDAFLISGGSDRFAYDVLHPRMMEWLLDDPRSQTLPFRFEGGNLLVWQLGGVWGPHVMTALEYACDILDRVPEFVWKD